MDGDHFNPDYFQYLLSSLTLNSRALITELTTAAEKFSENAEEIASLIDERIKKCLPQHKLFAIYLMDLICKNIGNPYNLIFGSKLYKIFTESYLYVTDTPTRQSLIDLFKTWSKAKTSAGLELFPRDVIQKIEGFIIKATSISQPTLQDSTNSGLLSSQIMFSGGGPGSGSVGYLTRDMLLREGNYLLQFIIALNAELDKYPYTQEMGNFQKINDSIRNPIIMKINEISEAIISMNRQAFDQKSGLFQSELLSYRKKLDEQVVIQKDFLKQQMQALLNQDRKNPGDRRLSSDGLLPSSTPQAIIDPIILDYTPDIKFFSNWTVEISQDEELLELINAWGMPMKVTKEPIIDKVTISDISTPSEQSLPDPSPANALGMNLTSLKFLDSMLSPASTSSEPYISPEDDDELYNPQDVTDEALMQAIPRFNGVMPPSNLKRPNANNESSERKIKRVRFAEDI